MRRPPLFARLVPLVLASAVLLAPEPGGGPTAQEPPAPAPAPAKPTLSEAVAATALPLRLEDGRLAGRLTGPGADWLRERAAESAAVVVGESHGVAEIPGVIGALVADLRSLGYHHLAIETGPVTAARLERLLREGGDGLEELVESHPFGVPFYGWRSEAGMLREALSGDRPAGGSPMLWGVDQEFVMSTPMHLLTLREMALPEGAAAAVEALLARPVDPNAPPQAHPLALTSLTAEDFGALDAALGDDAPPAARRIVDELLASHEVYRLFVSGDNYGSNALRADMLRRNLLAHYRAAAEAEGAPPRFVAKLGLAHTYRGRTSNNAFDIGNLALALGDEQGRRSLNVGVVCGPGSRSAGFGGPPNPCPPTFPTLGTPEGGGWVLYDFEAVRSDLHMGRLEVDDPALERMVWNLDGVVVLPKATPAEPLVSSITPEPAAPSE